MLHAVYEMDSVKPMEGYHISKCEFSKKRDILGVGRF
jgi:hypothetical protein